MRFPLSEVRKRDSERCSMHSFLPLTYVLTHALSDAVRGNLYLRCCLLVLRLMPTFALCSRVSYLYARGCSLSSISPSAICCTHTNIFLRRRSARPRLSSASLPPSKPQRKLPVWALRRLLKWYP